MLLGKVKWFDNKKGYGFILPIDENEKKFGDVFIHHQRIQKNGFKTLKENQMVKYQKIETDNGIMADNVQIVEASTFDVMENIIAELIKLKTNISTIELNLLSYVITQNLISEKLKDNSVLVTYELINKCSSFDYILEKENEENISIKQLKAIELYLEKIDENEEIHNELMNLIFS